MLFFLSFAWAEVGYYRQPTSDGETIVFVAEDDLWTVPFSGGEARRLVDMEGVELYPLLSEDGKELFWTGEAAGNREIYRAKLQCCGRSVSTPIEKWERLTWRQGADIILGFAREANTLWIRNTSQSPFYRSDIEVLELHTGAIRPFLEGVHRLSHAGEMSLWQDHGTDWQPWKQYAGGMAPDIWLVNGDQRQNISNWKGEDINPFWIEDQPYFLSDRAGNMGLFTWKDEEVEAIFVPDDWDLHSPKPMPNGQIIAEIGGQIAVIDPTSKTHEIIPIVLPSRSMDTVSFLLDEQINQVSLGDDGDIVMQYRGIRARRSEESWNDLGFAEYIDDTGKIWIQNGQLVMDGAVVERTRGFDLIGSPRAGRDWIAVRGQDLSLWLFSREDKREPILLHNNIRFPIEDFSWSEDGERLVFTGIDQRGIQGIYVYDSVAEKKTIVSQDFSHQHDPVWSNDEIVFLSSSEITVYVGKDNQQHIVSLDDRVVQYSATSGLQRLPIPTGTYQDLKIRNENVFLLSQAGELFRYDARDLSWQSLRQAVKAFQLGDQGSIFIWQEHELLWIDENGKVIKEISLAGEVREIGQREEWERMFDQTIRLISSSFFDMDTLPDDWSQRVAKYRSLIPRLRSRAELNVLLGELIAELGTSHLMVFGGGDRPSGVQIAELGIATEWRDRAWVITAVYNSGAELPFRLPQSVVGMCIREIDQQKPRKGTPIGYYLRGKTGQKFSITLQDCEKREAEVIRDVIGLYSNKEVKELDWMLHNREEVHRKTEGKIGYIHISNLQEEGLKNLERWIDVENRDAGLIVDLRYNGGGYYEAAAIERIFRAQEGAFLWANGQTEVFPYRAMTASKRVFLINGSTQSAGEGLALGAKARGAILVGERTWGGYSSFSQKQFADGGIVGITTMGWLEEEIENQGLAPDILISGEKNQLNKAIELLQAE